jgi:hypothetical protein
VEEYYRLIINLLKKHIDDGKTDAAELDHAFSTIDEAIAKAEKKKENITELLKLRTDLQFLKIK